jgi:hypothetical protein
LQSFKNSAPLTLFFCIKYLNLETSFIPYLIYRSLSDYPDQSWSLPVSPYSPSLSLLFLHLPLRSYFILFSFFLFFLLWDWGLNSGLCTCKAGSLLLEPHFQSILLCFFFFWRWGISRLFAWAGL